MVTLTAASGDRRSTARALFRPFGTMKTSLDDANSRAGYRQALLEMCEAYPGGQDPTAAWTGSHWNNLFRTLELSDVERIIELELQGLFERTRRLGYKVKITDGAKRRLAAMGYDGPVTPEPFSAKLNGMEDKSEAIQWVGGLLQDVFTKAGV